MKNEVITQVIIQNTENVIPIEWSACARVFYVNI
jgi:hypothetical protein